MVTAVAGTTVPAFVERAPASGCSRQRSAPVAGTTVPAFVERTGRRGYGARRAQRLSPGLRSRPSLSVTILLDVIQFGA